MGRLTRILAAMAIVVLGVTACGTSNTAGGKIGGTVHILGTWTGAEKDSFDAVMKPFTDQTGVKISFEATRDLDAILQTKIAAGNPPDVTGAPGIGTLIKLARAGKLPTLDDKLDLSQLNADYGADWITTEIKQAGTTWGKVLGSGDSNVFGGSRYMVATTFGDGGQGLFKSPPQCYMFNQGSFITSFFDAYTPKPTAGTDYAVFPLPDVSTAGAGAHVVAGDAFVMTKDTPQARALLKYLATADAQDIWVKRGGGKIAINKKVSLSDYPDAISKSLAQIVVATKIARYDAGDLMPSDMQKAYWGAVLKFVQNQSQLDAILADLDKTQATAYASP